MGIGTPAAWDDAVQNIIIRVGRTPSWWARLRVGKRPGLKVRVGTPDLSLTGVSGMVAVTELCEQLDVVGALDAAVGPIKQRARGQSAGGRWSGRPQHSWRAGTIWSGWNRRRADAAGRALTPVPGLSSTTTAGLARWMREQQWAAVETGLATVTTRMLTRLSGARREALLQTVTIDLATTDVDIPRA
jgi:hypothetical protein